MINELISEYPRLVGWKVVKRLEGGKDNLTWEIQADVDKSGVIQIIRSVHSQKHLDFISYVLSSFPEPKFLAPALPDFPQRFIRYKDVIVQIMARVPGKILDKETLTGADLVRAAQTLGIMHQLSLGMQWDERQIVSSVRGELSFLLSRLSGSTPIEQKLAQEMKRRAALIGEIPVLEKGWVHGDPAFKNFLVAKDNFVLLDYDRMGWDSQIWDLADLIRSCLKLPWFDSCVLWAIIDEYSKFRILTAEELECLPAMVRTLTLDTGSRYLLALQPGSDYFDETNMSLERAEGCLQEHDRVTQLFEVIDEDQSRFCIKQL